MNEKNGINEENMISKAVKRALKTLFNDIQTK